MRKLGVRVVVGAAGLIFVLCAGLLSVLLPEKYRLDRDAAEYARRVTQGPTLKNWSEAAFLEEAAPEYGAGGTETDVRNDAANMLTFYKRKFGSVDRVGKITASAQAWTNGQTGAPQAIAQVSARVVFERGPGDVVMLLVKRFGAWKIESLVVYPAG